MIRIKYFFFLITNFKQVNLFLFFHSHFPLCTFDSRALLFSNYRHFLKEPVTTTSEKKFDARGVGSWFKSRKDTFNYFLSAFIKFVKKNKEKKFSLKANWCKTSLLITTFSEKIIFLDLQLTKIFRNKFLLKHQQQTSSFARDRIQCS